MDERTRQIEERRKAIQKENELRAAYRKKFGGGDAEAKLMLEDLEKLCFFREPAFDKGEANQPWVTIHRDGLRAVVCHIKTMSSAKPLKEDELIKQLENEIDTEEGV